MPGTHEIANSDSSVGECKYNSDIKSRCCHIPELQIWTVSKQHHKINQDKNWFEEDILHFQKPQVLLNFDKGRLAKKIMKPFDRVCTIKVKPT